MEGTKHEKAVLVILSYVVGLTSGFIGFGLTQTTDVANEFPQTVLSTEVEQMNQEVTSPADESEILESSKGSLDANSASKTGVSVAYIDGRLTIDVNGSVQLLSVERSRLNLEAASYFTKQGTHVVEPIYVVSPDSNFMYFCEQSNAKDSCQSFVYDIENQMIHYVTKNGDKLVLPRAEAQRVQWNGSQLTFDDSTSDSTSIPWALTVK